jgi:hypothetical protein
MDLEKLGASKEHEGQALIHLIQIQENLIQVLIGAPRKLMGNKFVF